MNEAVIKFIFIYAPPTVAAMIAAAWIVGMCYLIFAKKEEG